MRAHTHTHSWTHIIQHTCTHTPTCTHIHMHTLTHVHTYARTYSNIHMHVNTRMHTFSHILLNERLNVNPFPEESLAPEACGRSQIAQDYSQSEMKEKTAIPRENRLRCSVMTPLYQGTWLANSASSNIIFKVFFLELRYLSLEKLFWLIRPQIV